MIAHLSPYMFIFVKIHYEKIAYDKMPHFKNIRWGITH